MNKKLFGISMISAGLLLAGPSTSFADFKTYAGSECERFDENVDPATYLNGSGRFNPSTTSILRMDCPAVHDRYGNISRTWIRVVDQNPADSVCARMVAVRNIGMAFVQVNGPVECTPPALNSPKAWQLNTTIPIFPANTDMHYYHSVYNIPKSYFGRDSGVVSYQVTETNGFD